MCRLGYCEKSTTCPFLYTAAVIKINTNRRFFIDITQIKKNTVSYSMELLFPIEKNVVFNTLTFLQRLQKLHTLFTEVLS